MEHSRRWSNTKKLFMESTATNVPLQLAVCLSLSSLFFMFLFCFFSLSFVYPSHLSSVTYEGSEANIAIMAQGHGHASRALTGNLPYPSLLYFIFFILFFLSPIITSRMVGVSTYYLQSTSRRHGCHESRTYTTTSCLDAISGGLPSLLLLLVHLPSFRCDRLNRRSRSIIFWKSKVEEEEEKKKDVWSEVR